jgi:hypothetical protein
MMKNRIVEMGSVILLVLYVVIYVWQPGGKQLLTIVSDALTALFAVLATVYVLRAAWMFEPDELQRRALLLFGIGLALSATAEILWAYYQVILGQKVPFPSMADIAWSFAYIPLFTSLLLQYRAMRARADGRGRLIALSVCSVLLLLTFVTLLGPMISNASQGDITKVFLNLFYPMGDLSLALFAILSLLVLWRGLLSQPWQYLVISILLFAIADLVYSYGTFNNLYGVGSNLLSGIVDVGYLSAYVMALSGAHRQATLRLPAFI